MKIVELQISRNFEKTYEIPTYGSDGSKHRIGASGGDGCYTLNGISILQFEKIVNRNHYSGRINRFERISKSDINLIPMRVSNVLEEFIKKNKLKKGKNFEEFKKKLINMFIDKDFYETKPQEKVFSRKEVIVKY